MVFKILEAVFLLQGLLLDTLLGLTYFFVAQFNLKALKLNFLAQSVIFAVVFYVVEL